MHLESIFGGGDIRIQLPEEAKKFDNVDKTFKKVGRSIQQYYTRAIIWIACCCY